MILGLSNAVSDVPLALLVAEISAGAKKNGFSRRPFPGVKYIYIYIYEAGSIGGYQKHDILRDFGHFFNIFAISRVLSGFRRCKLKLK